MARTVEKKSAPEEDVIGLEALLGHVFRRKELLTLAVTHRSYVYDKASQVAGDDLANPAHDNEQLEFMGDAVLGLLVAEALCDHFPDSREGELTRLRATLVSRKHLGEVGARLDLGRWLRLGHTAERNHGRTNPALFANAMEALIAALYVDAGLDAARRFVTREVLAGAFPVLEQSISGETSGGRFSGAVGDYKSALQELLQAAGLARPQYLLVREVGPDHRRTFQVEVQSNGEVLARAEGPSKKQAQQEAARDAVAKLRERGVGGEVSA